jgi:prepilin-type N-terminal cleavage/methylation domain-containing protein
MFSPQARKTEGFTLIELLVVIAIIAVLAVVVILTLNPAQLLAQSRDSQRLSDMATLQSALNLYTEDQSGVAGYSLGVASTSYLSVPDPSSIACVDLGMPSSSYSYQCASSTSYRRSTGAGWIPVDLASTTTGSPIGSIPVDPVNQTSTDLYYTYTTNGIQYQVNAFLESSKYAKTAFNDAGSDPSLLEVGPGSVAMPDTGRGLVGYWPLDEGQGTTTIDWSGAGNNGTWHGTAIGTSGYYSPGHVWQWGGAFDGATDYILGSSTFAPSGSNPVSFAAWAYLNAASATGDAIISEGTNSAGGYEDLRINSNGFLILTNGSASFLSTLTPPTTTWFFMVATLNGTAATMCLNANCVSGTQASTNVVPSSFEIGAHLGTNGFPWIGYIDDVRMYDRVLSNAEIQEIYSAEK